MARAWGRIAVPTGVDLMAIWGASDKDIWAVGEAGVVIHWDGTSWSRTTTPVPDSATLNDVWGRAAVTSGPSVTAASSSSTTARAGAPSAAHHQQLADCLGLRHHRRMDRRRPGHAAALGRHQLVRSSQAAAPAPSSTFAAPPATRSTPSSAIRTSGPTTAPSGAA